MSDLIERCEKEIKELDSWIEEGESVVIGNAPHLLLECIERIKELEAEVKELERRHS